MRVVLACVLAFGFGPELQGQIYEKVFDFGESWGSALQGSNPIGLVQDNEGNFFGVTETGHAGGSGLIFKMTPSGIVTILSDRIGDNLAYLDAELLRATDGNFYGITQSGGEFDNGTVYRMTPSGEVTILVNFTWDGITNKGGSPQAALIQGGDGWLYGTTSSGGSFGDGTVFKLSLEGELTTLFEFGGSPESGNSPSTSLLLGEDGNFYGTTDSGGIFHNGTVFRISASGILTYLVHFSGTVGPDKGSFPTELIIGKDGNLYGATRRGGTHGLGTVFRMSPIGEVDTLVEFAWADDLQTRPLHAYPSPLIQGSDGAFYGTTVQGGAEDFGTIFKMNPDGALTTLVEFDRTNGSSPIGRLIQGKDGNYYGTTSTGGSADKGTIFRMTPGGELVTLVEAGSNSTKNRGSWPWELTEGPNGSIYGLTTHGGSGSTNDIFSGYGTVFELKPNGELVTLVEFTGTEAPYPGEGPRDLIVAEDGTLWGTTDRGGAYDHGTLFRIGPSGSFTTLVEFSGDDGPTSGRSPHSLIAGNDGHLYGLTSSNHYLDHHGTVFRLTDSGVLETLVEFTGSGVTTGIEPNSLILGEDGNFYGTTSHGGLGMSGAPGTSGYGTFFKLSPAGEFTTLVEFSNNGPTNKGSRPFGLFPGIDGSFYGVTAMGGLGFGTVFKVTREGHLTTLVEFSGSNPVSGGMMPRVLVQTDDGSLYGTTDGGGIHDHGTVFKISPEGTFSTLVDFSGDGSINKGSRPIDAIIPFTDGHLYGATIRGGRFDYGTLFKVNPLGQLTTVHDFPTGPDGWPSTRPLPSSDGNLYGTSGEPGSIYRLIFPGKPMIGLTKVGSQGGFTTIETKVNPRGYTTQRWPRRTEPGS